MRRIRLIIILFCAVSMLAGLKAQAQHHIRFQNLGVGDGLSMGTITGVQKDLQGFIWISTAEGLHRYDGIKFKIFKHEDGVAGSLSDSYIRCMQLKGDLIYMGTNAGTLDMLNTSNHQIRHLNFTAQDPSFDFPISCLALSDELAYIGTEGGGLWTLDLETERLQRVDALSMSVINAIELNDGQVVVGGESGIFSSADGYAQAWLQASVLSIEQHQGNWFAGTNRGLWKNTGVNWSRVQLPAKKRRIQFVTTLLSLDSVLWVGTHGGLLRLDGSHQQLYRHEPLRHFSLVSDKVSALFDDGDGVLWIGTLSGLSRHARELRKFGLLAHFDFEGETHNNNVYCAYPVSNEGIWLGTLTGGMARFQRGQGIVEVIPLVKDGAYESRAVRSLYQDSKGRFWVGTRDAGLFLYLGNGQFKSVRGSGQLQLGGQVIRAIFEDHQGRIWIGHEHGLALLDETQSGFVNFAAEPRSRTNNAIYQILEDTHRDQLIIGSFRGGIQLFDLDDMQYRSLKYSADDSSTLSNNNVMCMEWIGRDSLAVGTYGGGLNILDLRTETFSHFTELDGLANNAVYGILRDGHRALWLSTNNGLSRWDLHEGGFANFRTVHYLQSTEFNEGAFCKDSEGWFYFGGVSGLNFFDPEHVPFRIQPPSLAITDIRGQYERNGERLSLQHGNTRLELDYTALYYADPGGVQYRYRMKGYDQNWVEAGNAHTAYYSRLEPGQYTFELQAKDEFGRWIAYNSMYHIAIRPPYWQTWWFIFLIGALGALGVWLIFRMRTREIKRGYQLQLVDSELSALRSQMNPHFIFNSLNSIQYYILKKEPQEAYNYLSKFASLMRKILQNSRYRYIAISDEIEWLELYLEMERLRLDDELEVHIECIDLEDPSQILIPTMLVQPYVENSIIHGLLPKEKDRQISIRFTRQEEVVCCEIEDNGIGRSASAEMNAKRTNKHRSAGMNLTRSRLRILSEGKGHYDVQIEDLEENGEAKGTRVSVLFPIITKEDGQG